MDIANLQSLGKTTLMAAAALLMAGGTNAATPNAADSETATSQTAVAAIVQIEDAASEVGLVQVQFMGGRRTDYSKRRRYRGSRTRFSRKRLPRGAASNFGPSKFTHGQPYTGGQGVRVTDFDNGFHGGRRIRQRIR